MTGLNIPELRYTGNTSGFGTSLDSPSVPTFSPENLTSVERMQSLIAQANNTTSPLGNIIGNDGGGEGSSFLDFLGDSDRMSGLAGLASVGLQAFSLPTMLKNAKLQNKSLKFNLDTAKQEQARRNRNIAGFNSHGSTPSTPSVPTTRRSAFAGYG